MCTRSTVSMQNNQKQNEEPNRKQQLCQSGVRVVTIFVRTSIKGANDFENISWLSLTKIAINSHDNDISLKSASEMFGLLCRFSFFHNFRSPLILTNNRLLYAIIKSSKFVSHHPSAHIECFFDFICLFELLSVDSGVWSLDPGGGRRSEISKPPLASISFEFKHFAFTN